MLPLGAALFFRAAVVTPPAQPTTLHATVVSSSGIYLSWDDNASDETSYELQRASDSGFTTGIVTHVLAANTRSYSETGLSANTQYWWRVRALKGSTPSDWSSTVTATTATTTPLAPSGLSATVLSSASIRLDFTDNAVNETGFDIYMDGALHSSIGASAGTGAVSTTVTGLTEGVSHTWKVRATNAGGNSAFSNQVTQATKLATPTGFSGTGSGVLLQISWTNASTHYNNIVVMRDGSDVATLAHGTTSYSPGSVAGNQWQVRATGAGLPDSAPTSVYTDPG